MTTVHTKFFACFMGFAVLSIFNVNNSFARDFIRKSTVEEKITKTYFHKDQVGINKNV